METKHYRIETDSRSKLMQISFSEIFWDMATAQRFKADCLAATASIACAPGEHLVLVDLRNAVLQSKDVYEKMQHLVGNASAARIALVASTPLARMQTKRLQIRDDVVMFAEITDARDWLFAVPEQAAA